MRLALCTCALLALACSTAPQEEIDPVPDTVIDLDSGDPSDAIGQDLVDARIAADGALPADGGLELPPPPPYCAQNDLECGYWTDETTQSNYFCGGCPFPAQWCTPGGGCDQTPACGPGGLTTAASFEWDAVQPAGWLPRPGHTFATLLRLKVANPEACPWCDRVVLAERFPPLDDESTICLELGPVANCDGHTDGAAVIRMLLKEGEEPPAYRISLAPPGITCEDDWMSLQTGKSFDETFLWAPSPGDGCEDVCKGLQCGLVSGCGIEQRCGNCPPDHRCDDHECVLATPCSIDALTITDVLLDGFKQDAVANPGEEVPVLFSWTLAGAEGADELPRQLVIGIGNQPGFCADVDYVQTCPSLSAGLASGTVEAPFEAGAYALEAVVTATPDCTAASALFAATWPRQTLGTLVVEGTCSPLSCQQLGAECGFQSDGCGGSIACGGCSPGTYCQAGSCLDDPACADDSFSPLHVNLQGQGMKATVGLGRPVAFSLSLQGARGQECPSCTRLLAIAVGDEVAYCQELTGLPQCPEYFATGIGGFFPPPQTPGNYPVRAAIIMEDDCSLAQAAFADYDPVAIGSLAVQGTCHPFDCATLDKDCGNWGDGCGGFLHCGQCGSDETCSFAGSCDNPCTKGLFNVLGISINGSGAVASSPPDKSVLVNLGFEVGNGEDCPGCPIQIVIGIDNDPQECAAAGAPEACPDTAAGDLVTHVQAPSKPGVYTIYAWPSTAADCSTAKGEFIANPERTKLGTLHVTDGCSPKSCLSMGKKCGFWEDGCNITLQCGTCPSDELCDAMGACYCSSADEYEPNNSADKAFDFGEKTDNDGSSHVTIQAAVNQESDWFRMGATDKNWAYMEPFVQVTPGNPTGFKAVIAYRCLDGTYPASYNSIQDDGCDLVKNTSYPGLGSVSSAWECTPKAGVIAIQFGPHCALVDDSGEIFVAVSNQGPCSAYELDMHL